MILPRPAPVEKEILDYFADRNFERSRYAGAALIDAVHLYPREAEVRSTFDRIHRVVRIIDRSAAAHKVGNITTQGCKVGTDARRHFCRRRIDEQRQFLFELE